MYSSTLGAAAQGRRGPAQGPRSGHRASSSWSPITRPHSPSAGELDAAQRAIGEALAHRPGQRPRLGAAAPARRASASSSATTPRPSPISTDGVRARQGARHRAACVAGLERAAHAAPSATATCRPSATRRCKLAQLLLDHGDLERGRGFLVAWIERDAARRRAAVHAVRPRRIDRALGRRRGRRDAPRLRHRG